MLAGTSHGLGGHGAGALGAVAQHLFDVAGVGGEFGALGAIRREEIPVVFKQRLLEVAVTEAAGAEAVFKVGRGVRHGRQDVLQRLQDCEPVDPSLYYASVSPSFDAPEGPHDWLCRTMFVGKVDRRADRALFTYWAVL